MANALLDAALDYAARGWAVFPCKPHLKEPLTANGFKDASTDAEIIRQWWAQWPDANIGLACGASRLAVIDIDVKNGVDGRATWGELLEQYGYALGETVCQETPSGGAHYLYQMNGVTIRNSASKLGPGLDTRGDGGYIVVAPSIHPNGGEYTWAWGHAPNEIALATLPEALVQALHHTPQKAAAPTPSGNTLPLGARNQALTSMAGAMRRKGMTENEIYAALSVANQERCIPPLDETELHKIAGSVARYAPAEAVNLTDLGNATRLVTRHGAALHYCFPQQRWYVWGGARWENDQTGEIVRRAKETIRALYDEAAKIEDDDERKRLVGWAMKSEASAKLDAMIALARSEDGIPITPQQMDADPWALNCLNGTLDLQTGRLRPHNAIDLITKLAPVSYDPAARHPMWERFLSTALGNDDELIAFLARAVGYSLTGLPVEERLFFVHGPAGAGKSTFIEAIKATLGDYAMTADFETFLARSMVGGIRNDVARLAGARFVASIEVDEGKKLAEGLVKTITGGDTVTARHLYQEAFEFKPQFTLWLCANYAPQVKDNDAAMWRRILRIPFERVIAAEQRDPAVKAALRDPQQAGPAILAWAVRGCLEWQRIGLAIPQRVLTATEEYRQEMNPLQDFAAECCLMTPTAITPSAKLREAYEVWAKEAGYAIINGKLFAERLRAMGCKPELVKQGGTTKRCWVGIGLRSFDDEPVTAVTAVTAVSVKSPTRENQLYFIENDVTAVTGVTGTAAPDDEVEEITTI